MRKSILAASSLIGTIIGAGIFAIPFVMAKSGLLISLFYFVILVFVVLCLHLFFGEIVLRTKEQHELTGYTEKYLGKKAKNVVMVATILGTIGSLLVYIILGGSFLKVIAPFDISQFQLGLLFWSVMVLITLSGIKSIAWSEFLMDIGVVAVFIIIALFCFPNINVSNFALADFNYFLLPFGVLLFSLVGWNIIPELPQILENKKQLKKVIIFASLFCAILYLIFGLIVVSVSGSKTTPEPFLGLSAFLGPNIVFLGAIFGLLAIGTSFSVLASYLVNTLVLDCRWKKSLAFFLVVFSPLALFVLGARHLIEVITFVGIFVGLAEGTAIALAFKKAKKAGDRKPEYEIKADSVLLYFIIFVLLIGTIAEIVNYFVKF